MSKWTDEPGEFRLPSEPSPEDRWHSGMWIARLVQNEGKRQWFRRVVVSIYNAPKSHLMWVKSHLPAPKSHLLWVTCESYMTSQQARQLARVLTDAADRVDELNKEEADAY